VTCPGSGAGEDVVLAEPAVGVGDGRQRADGAGRGKVGRYNGESRQRRDRE
jgi:hypothetical protein